MFGAAGKILSPDLAVTFIVTEGFSSPLTGYKGVPTTFGSITPSAIRGQNVNAAAYNTTSTRAIVWIDGNLPKDFFYSVQFEDGAELFSSAATHSYRGATDGTEWYWTQSKPARWDGSGTSTLIFKPYDFG